MEISCGWGCEPRVGCLYKRIAGADTLIIHHPSLWLNYHPMHCCLFCNIPHMQMVNKCIVKLCVGKHKLSGGLLLLLYSYISI